MTRIRSLRPIVVALVAVLAAACGSPMFPDRAPTLEGQIVGIGNTVPFGSERTVWVKTHVDAPCGVVFRIESRTDIGEVRADGSIADRSFEDLEVGRRVTVWSGAVAESCPGQATADAIRISSEAD